MAGVRSLHAVLSAAALAGALFVAVHHPIAPFLAGVAVCAYALIVAFRPAVWTVAIPALLPVLDFSPWTGWLMFDEFDLLVLATAAGGYAALAWRRVVPSRGRPRLAPTSKLLIGLLFGWAAVEFIRGVLDAGGFSFGWFDGYQDPGNSLRLFKPFFLSLLILPLLVEETGRDAAGTAVRFASGMLAGLCAVTAAAVWERAMYPGLLDFSMPYRTSALFWEMHVGGAALDAYLALACPFAAWALFEARRPWQWLGAAVLAVCTGYVYLMTFSRGIYIAIPFGLGIAVLLRRRAAGAAGDRVRAKPWLRLGLGGAFYLVCVVAFKVAGYWGLGLLLAGVVGVAAGNVLGARVWWARNLQMRGTIVVAAMLVVEIAAVVNGGSFLVTRMMAGGQDLGGRVAHWRAALGLLDDPGSWLFGKGLGRLPAYLSAGAPTHQLPADFRLRNSFGNGYVALYGPRSDARLSGLFGIAQRISGPGSEPLKAELDLRTGNPVTLEVAVCENHLLDDVHCASGRIEAPASAAWQHASVELVDTQARPDDRRAQRQHVFSISVLTLASAVDIDNIILTDGKHQLIQTGNFDESLARWFLSGQVYFLPWHLDNWLLEVLFEQGLAGVVVLAMLMLLTGRLLVRCLPPYCAYAPFIGGALAGLTLAGSVISFMDVPRVAFLFLLLVIWAHSSRAEPIV